MPRDFILVSQHKSTLRAAQERYDKSYKQVSRSGFWRGFCTAIWITVAAVYFTALAAFNLGANL